MKPTVTLYDVLGCTPTDAVDTLHSRYLDLAFALHPDRGGDAEKFKAVALAWGTLKNSDNRKRYDAQLRLERQLNCTACAGTGRRSSWVNRHWQKDAVCAACAGRGHV